MDFLKKTTIILLLLLVAGLLRVPFERPLAREMRSAGILPEPINLETSEALGQTSAAIALGGLRSLVAAVLNFSKVVPAWQDRDWLGIFDTFEQIHTLQPETGYYWEAAAGYAADDAYSDFRDRAGVPEWRRKLRRDEFFQKGEGYLTAGIENLPEDIRLYQMKARLRSDIYKPEHIDYAAAANVLDKAVQLENATDVLRRYRLYLMSRVPERRSEALQLARQIYQDPMARYPSVKSLIFALQNEFPEAPGQRIPDRELYKTDAEFLRGLFNHYQRREEKLPMVGVREEIERLVKPMDLPYSLDPLRNSDIARITGHLEDIYRLCPLTLPTNINDKEGDWGQVVALFQDLQADSSPTVRVLFFVLQNLAAIPAEDRVPLSKLFPNKLYALRDLANYQYDSGHSYPRAGVAEALEEIATSLQLSEELNPVKNPDRFPFDKSWMEEVQNWQYRELNVSAAP